MPLDKSRLFDFLEALDEEVSKEITVVAVGGTAMTLLDLKTSTIDIDFTIPSGDIPEFKAALDSLQPGYKVDLWPDGCVFSQILPDDYLGRSSKAKDFKRIHLRVLHPVDIVVTKIGRLEDRDIQDIEACIRKFKISKIEIEERAADVHYVGKDENYIENLKYVLWKFY